MKRIRAVLSSLAAGCALTGLTACGGLFELEPRDVQEPHVYDIGRPAQPFSGVKRSVEVRPFRMDGVSKLKMVGRVEKNRLIPDGQNCWSMMPGLLVSRYLTQSFAAAEGKPGIVISGHILNFEMNVEKKEAFFSAVTEIDFGNGTQKTYTDSISVPVQEISASAFSEAMEKAVAQFAELLRKRI